MIGFPTPISGLGFTPILPWLPELEHLPPKSLKRLTRVLPELQARIEHLVADLGSDHEENNEEDEGDDNDDDDGSNKMDVGDSPSKRSSVGSGVPGSGEPAYIKTGIKVWFSLYRSLPTIAEIYYPQVRSMSKARSRLLH